MPRSPQWSPSLRFPQQDPIHPPQAIKYFLHKVQLHVSALGNDHLLFVYEILIKQLYKTYVGC